MIRRCLYLISLLGLIGCGSNGEGADPDAADGACSFHTADDDLEAPPIHTPRWAFEPWISKDISDAQDTYDFVAGFRSRDIPVGVVVLDSPWETHYNTFVPNPDRYPNFEKLVTDLREDNIRTVLWMTQMINKSSVDFEPGGDTYEGASPNFAEAERCGFLVNEAQGYLWWKGVGAGLDFFNEDAVAWWRRQQDALLELGINGWKLDFGDEYVPGPLVYTKEGPKPHQEYSEAYYRDFYTYGASKVGTDEFVTMVRPYDESYGFPGRFFARKEHAPVGWVGDQRRDWFGLSDALDHLFRSADAGYVMIGSDVGGYLDFNDLDMNETFPFDTLVFARWTAVGALTPFFQLHGRANITPWTVPDNVDTTVELYRYWSYLHSELVPFFYSLAEEAYAGGEVIMRPIGELSSWTDDYRFMVGDAFLVAPILDASGVRDVELPAGTWYDWFDPTAAPRAGGQTLVNYDATDRRRIPLFVKAGAIVPTKVTNDVTGLGTASSTGHLTVLVYPGTAETVFRLHDRDDALTTITQKLESNTTTITLSRSLDPVILRVRADTATTTVTADSTALPQHGTRAAFDGAASGWFYDAPLRATWVKLATATSARTITLQ